jgi:hypothetical protein
MEIPEEKNTPVATSATPTTESAVSTAITKFNVESGTAVALREFFEPLERQANEWKEKAFQLVITDASQTEQIEEAKKARLSVRQIRLAIEKLHKEKKEDSLRKSQVLDLIKRTLVDLIEPIETHLKQQEDFVELQERNRAVELYKSRLAELEPYRVPGDNIDVLDLGVMSEVVFNGIKTGVINAHTAREQEKADEAKAKLEQEQAKEKEIEKLKLKNERMTRLQQLGAKVEFDQERKKDSLILWDKVNEESVTWILVDNITDFTNEEFENYYKDFVAVKASNDKFEADEKEARERYTRRVQSLTTIGFVWNARENMEHAGIQYALSKKQLENLKDAEFDPLFDELSLMTHNWNALINKDLEDKAAAAKTLQDLQAKQALENKQKELDAKKAARAPDKTKLLALAESIKNISQPELKDQAAKEVLLNVQVLLSKVHKYITEQCVNL